MERENVFQPKQLLLTYEEYQKRGCTLQNLVIDKYVVYDLIGVGSYGSVFSGSDDQTKKQVAIKVLDMRKMKAEKNEIIKKIKLRLAESEPRLMYQCDSPYLLKCYDVYQNEDLKIMVMQYCNGKTLQAEIDIKGRIPEREAWVILKHIINGLMELHKYKIIHRDLKAENVMSHNGTYKIIDFGFSKKLQISQENAELRNTSLGTITTMAPEVMSRKPYGLKADIWSLGIIFFQMIYGTYPYDSSTAAQMFREIQAKKLFNKEEPFSYNGYTPSKDAYNFLRFTIVVDSANRPDWKAVSEYPNIKNTDETLNQRFIKHCDVEVEKNLDYEDKDYENESFDSPIKTRPKKPKENVEQGDKRDEALQKLRKQEEERKEKEKEEKERKDREEYIKQTRRLEEEEHQKQEKRRIERERERKKEKEERDREKDKAREKERINARIRDINQHEARRKEDQINREEEQEYEWTQRAHLECLKTQFVYREILYPLEIAAILDIEDRNSIEFYYLLAVRCFNNMSPINDEIQQRTKKGRNKELISNLKTQITRLYNQVQKKFLYFSEKLTQSQNKTGSMLKDWFSKKLNSEKFQEKDKFLTGIEKIYYTKQEQIDYTCSYYNKKIRQVIVKGKNVTSIIKRMLYYRQIMLVDLNSLKSKGKNFEEYVQDKLLGERD